MAEALPGFTTREEQLLMADAVEEAFAEGRHLVVEAGTGVGKSFAYLVPALLEAAHGEKGRGPIVIATRTIALQEQLVERDIPFLLKALDLDLKVALAKGRGNYVCLRRMEMAAAEGAGLFENLTELEQLHRVREWAYQSKDGSRADLDFRPLPDVWDAVKAEAGNCLHKACPHYQPCAYQRSRRRLYDADILVANHALVLADLARRRNSRPPSQSEPPSMPVYEYRGHAGGNRSAHGMIDADSLRGARIKLRSQGIYPTRLVEGQARTPLSEMLSQLQLPEFRHVPALDLSLFTNQLATLIAAGIPLVQSLSALTEQVENARLKTVIGRVRESVNHGATLADSLKEHPTVFNELYEAMVRAGESAGALIVVLRRLSEYIEGQMELRNKVISAMMYPLIMIGMSMVVMGVLLVKVIPTISTLLEDLNQELPLPTVIVIRVSEAVTEYWIPAAVGMGLTFVVVSRLLRTERGRLTWDRIRLRLPVVGRVVRHVSIARFSRTLATLLQGGLNIISALEISKTVSGNAVIGRAIEDAKDAIIKGATIAQPLEKSGQFPPMVIHMVAVGEASGELDSMLGKVADTYDELVESSLDRLTALMGPILLIFVAVVVVVVIMSTLLPLMNLTASL